MNQTDDQLLWAYANRRDESAFAELAGRHADLVYSAALRQLGGDTHAAQDVMQAVFLDLARKAGRLANGTVVAGWLYRHTGFLAANHVRTERRRAQREQEAMSNPELPRSSDRDWEQLRPVLDNAMLQLAGSDRDALLLRFFRGLALADVGTNLGVSEEAARKRVDRALERLRVQLARRGLTYTGSAIAGLIAADATVTAPAAAVASACAAATGAAFAGGGLLGAMTTMSMTKIKLTAGSALLALVVGLPSWQQHRLREARAELERLTPELERLQQERPRVAPTPGANGENEELQRLRGEHAELIRLRGELSALRRSLQDQRSGAPPRPAGEGGGDFVQAENFADLGLGSPAFSVQTLCWAAVNGNKDRYRQAIAWGDEAIAVARSSAEHSLKEFNANDVFFTLATSPGHLQGFQIVSEQAITPDEVEVELAVDLKKGNTQIQETNRLRLIRSDGEWKWYVASPADVGAIPFRTEGPE